jgi:indole-3-glycerol phosphate synthase
MNADYLQKILEHKEIINREKKEYFAVIAKQLKSTKFNAYHLFKKMISKPGRINLIAEIKKASPSRGLIKDDFDLLKIVKAYVDSKVDAISILTEDKYFLGKPAYIKQVSENCVVPLLTKDFIVDEGQIYEARVNGASAVLLITSILDQAKLKGFRELANSLDLDALVEVHDEKELEKALKSGADIIGVNNRELKTFNVSLENSLRLIPKIPKDKVSVSESGIKDYKDILSLAQAGANAVLIGETLMTAGDIAAKIKEVMNG